MISLWSIWLIIYRSGILVYDLYFNSWLSSHFSDDRFSWSITLTLSKQTVCTIKWCINLTWSFCTRKHKTWIEVDLVRHWFLKLGKLPRWAQRADCVCRWLIVISVDLHWVLNEKGVWFCWELKTCLSCFHRWTLDVLVQNLLRSIVLPSSYLLVERMMFILLSYFLKVVTAC